MRDGKHQCVSGLCNDPNSILVNLDALSWATLFMFLFGLPRLGAVLCCFKTAERCAVGELKYR